MTRTSLKRASLLASEGTLIYGTEPTVGCDGEGNITLLWVARGVRMEMRVRDDGKINWYRVDENRATGNEGWSRHSPLNMPWRN